MMRRRFQRYFAVAICAMAALAGSGSLADEAGQRASLSDLMVLTQLRHMKLWYAGANSNWPLADYELKQLQAVTTEIGQLYPTASSVSQDKLIHDNTDPAVAAVQKAIDGKNRTGFETAFKQVTDACNQCHKAASLAFIVIRPPNLSPFANQVFEPVK